jgi:hypothetical protein
MKRLTLNALLAFASLFGALPAFSSTSAVRADVPFNFTVGQDLLPSGSYIISRDLWGIVRVQSLDQSRASTSVTTIGDAYAGTGDKLIFRKYGDRYFLGKVSSSAFSAQVPVFKTEKGIRSKETER